jgi:hypothetical protein
MILASALLAVSSLIGFTDAQCATFGTVDKINPAASYFPDAILFRDNILRFKLNYPPTDTSTIVIAINDTRIVPYPKTLTFTSTNFNVSQSVELALSDVAGFAPPYPITIGFVPRNGDFAHSCLTGTTPQVQQLAALTTTISLLSNATFASSSTTEATTQAGCACNAFVTFANPTPPAPSAFVQSGGTTYVDNVLYPRLSAAPSPGTTTTMTFSTGDSRIKANVSTLTFTAGNWNIPQPVALTIDTNSALAPPYNLNLNFTLTSSQSFFVPSYFYPLTFNAMRDALGCWYKPSCAFF